ncbi:unnamed protein product, partial [Staurois parvus]
MCHFQVSTHCWWVPFCHRDAGRLRASHCCCQARNLPWPPYRLLMLLPGPECVMGPCNALPLLLSPSPHLCHVPLQSPHTAGGFHFV